MSARRLLPFLMLLGLVACRPERDQHGQKHAGHDEHHDHPPEAPAAASAASPGVVRIDREMLRDLRITIAKAEARPSGDGVALLGELRVNEDAYAEVGPPIPARVAKLLASVGDEVKSGAPLAELENMDVGRARAEIASSTARIETARQRVERLKGLAADGIAPRRELEQAETDLKTAESDRAAAQSVLGAVGAGRGAGARFVLRSPIAGTVVDRKAALGRATDPEHPLFHIAELSELWLVVNAFERDAVRIRAGATARITFAALPGRSFDGRVVLVGRLVDPSARTVPVRLVVPNKDGGLRPGMSASAWVALGEATSTLVAVPVSAMQRMHDGWCVFVPRGEGVFERRAIGRGRDLGGEVEILTGLRAGESVVVQGAFLLKAEADKSRGEGEHHEH
jgi:membrane fusion protein, heavy metal efflux system